MAAPAEAGLSFGLPCCAWQRAQAFGLRFEPSFRVRIQVLAMDGYRGIMRWGDQVAEREGFEPSVRLQTVHSLSRRARSTTPAPLRILDV